MSIPDAQAWTAVSADSLSVKLTNAHLGCISTRYHFRADAVKVTYLDFATCTIDLIFAGSREGMEDTIQVRMLCSVELRESIGKNTDV